MKIPRIVESFNHIDDDLIEEAAVSEVLQRKRSWRSWMTVAACLCIAVIGIMGWKWITPSKQQKEQNMEMEATEEEAGDPEYAIQVSEEGVTIPDLEISLSAEDGAAACMLGFFIYQGNVYTDYEQIYEEADIIDKHLGSITGLIDEWTPSDGYVDYAGSVRGEIYSVKGYDPSFMICMKESDGSIRLFIRNTGITLKSGADLFKDRMHLAGNYSSVQYENDYSWSYGKGERYELEPESDIITEFVEELYTAECMSSENIPTESDRTAWPSLCEFHVYFKMDNGIEMHLWLLKGSYVVFHGVKPVCVKISDEVYDALTDLLSAREGARTDHVPWYLNISLDRCIEDPELGSYVPTYVPQSMMLEQASVYYYLDPETGDETGTKEILISYSEAENPAIYYGITISWADEYGDNGWAGPMIHETELSLGVIEEHMEYTSKVTGEPREYNRIDIGVWYGDIYVALGGAGLDAEEVLNIFESIVL